MFISCQTDELGDPGDGPDDAEKFLGTWNVNDQSARLNYTVKITRDPVYANQVIMQNFADAGGSATGSVVGNTITIDKQPIGDNYNAEGTGNFIKTDRLIFTFDLDDGIDLEKREATFTK
jgi:hypothetical protein